MRVDLQSLHDLLTRERAALRQGEYAALPDIAAEKMQRLQVLANLTPPDITALHAALDRNARLIAAARDGFHDALSRRRDLRQSAEGFAAYAADGTRAPIAATRPPAFERRR